MSAEKEFTLADFRPLAERLCTREGRCALIGGIAVALYGETYLKRASKEHYGFPIHSKDLDLEGSRETKQRVVSELTALGLKCQSGGTR